MTASKLTLLLCMTALFTNTAQAQFARDTATSIARLHAAVAEHDAVLEHEVWPGYHFGQLGLMYIIPGRAKVLVSWPGDPPAGTQALEGFNNTRWIDTSVVRWPGGLPVATLAISPRQSRAAVAGLALHEAFHAFEFAQREPGRRFGRGENALVTSRYPIFDVENEAAILVENQLLRSALAAKTDVEARRDAQQFLAVRQRRQARLDSTFVNFEKAAEQHEGLAQYVLLRGLAVLAERDASYRDGAAAELRAEKELLANSLGGTNLSVLRRAYATGSHIGLLLDRLAGASWKQRVMRDDAWLQDILALVVGSAAVSSATEARIRSANTDASIAIAALRTRRALQRDSVLAMASVKLSLDPSALSGRFDWCGFDPQNLLATGSGQLIHTRFVNLCINSRRFASLGPAVEDQFSGRVTTAVDLALVKLTVAGSAVSLPPIGTSVTVDRISLQAGDIEIDLPRAVIARGDKTLLILPTN